MNVAVVKVARRHLADRDRIDELRFGQPAQPVDEIALQERDEDVSGAVQEGTGLRKTAAMVKRSTGAAAPARIGIKIAADRDGRSTRATAITSAPTARSRISSTPSSQRSATATARRTASGEGGAGKADDRDDDDRDDHRPDPVHHRIRRQASSHRPRTPRKGRGRSRRRGGDRRARRREVRRCPRAGATSIASSVQFGPGSGSSRRRGRSSPRRSASPGARPPRDASARRAQPAHRSR